MTTDEAERQQGARVQLGPETDRDPEPSGPQDVSPEEPALRPRTRSSASRGLSRLLSSFLNRRSQCSSEEEGGLQPAEETRDDGPKAPIADPEPELRIEGDPTLDLHSLSSAEIQSVHEDQKDDPETEKDSLEQEEEEEDELEEEGETENQKEDKAERGSKTPRVARRTRTMHCKVTLLDNAQYECDLEKHARGQELFSKVCDHLNLLERDYYGLAIWETPTCKTWLDLTKEIRRQTQGTFDFTFNVKFYPPDPAQLTEDITRYYLCLQLRKDILSGRLPCSFVTLALLGSYVVQSELGEYDPELHGAEYVRDVWPVLQQSRELQEKVMELHRTYRAMTPAQADMMFLENAKKLSMYGVDFHQAKDLDGVDIMLGVCSSGLMVYKDKLRINRFPWPKVLKISYKRSSFFIKIRPSEQEHYESAIGFKLPNCKSSKKLWKVCVEHHTFFRLTSTEVATTPRRFLALGSKFRYSGRTQAQTRQASSMIDRPAPLFQRSASKRASRSLDEGMVFLFTPLWVSIAASEERQEDNESSESKQGIQAKKIEGETIYIRHSNLMLEDVEKTQGELLRHHASISELKRSFMEAVPEPRASEWDKRLSTHSPFRSITINGQLQPGGDGVSAPKLKRGAERRKQRRAAAPGGPPAPSEGDPENNDEEEEQGTEAPSPKVMIAILHDGKQAASAGAKPCQLYPATLQRPPGLWGRSGSNSQYLYVFVYVVCVCVCVCVCVHVHVALQSPLVKKTQTVTISDITNSLRSDTTAKEVPVVHTETRTITYESPQVNVVALEQDGSMLLSAQTISSDTVCTTTTTQITKTVKGGISETRIEKRIVITGDMEIDHDKALAQAIKEAKEQHPDMFVTRVVVHQETEITPE
uniref:Protein 4.1 n=1 Tax=Scleropages formosus TaxID=113540 RepID=A0A8D0C9F2_SCLFO